MRLAARMSLEVNGTEVTARQLEAFLAVQEAGSQSEAARRLGVSVPVLHRYVSAVEAAAGTELLKTTPAGTTLTPAGRELAEYARAMAYRCRDVRGFTVCCSPVTEDLMQSAVSAARISRPSVVVSDDENSISMMLEGRADFALIDDPLYLFDLEGFEMQEIAYMGMVLVDNGPSFIRYRYGAQRVAFMYLDSLDREYSVDAETSSVQELLGSGKSFFVDELVLMRRNIRVKSAVDPKMLRHAVTAIYRKETRNVTRLMRALASKNYRRRLYLKR